ncbi:MAG: tetratricopeptide repeat protein [Chloroflexi bacterium]|nr:tetratricopeptide repeat protein [Chloroflexota bacterium]
MASVSLQVACDQARQWLESGDVDRAMGLARHILVSHPHNLDVHRIIGEAHLASRNLQDAQAAFETVLRADPENIPARVSLGITHERRNEVPQAIAAFELALEIKPDLAELRNQLLRLYADAWGNEYAQLRLSRAGLARLYARGNMLPQAISEFQHVINEAPDRLDIHAALAEALWRNEDEAEALRFCREVLTHHADLLKANLIVGFLEMAHGSVEGERCWERALALDPYLQVARTLFDRIPPQRAVDPLVEAWDEQRWATPPPDDALQPTRTLETPTANAAVYAPGTAAAARRPVVPAAPAADAFDADSLLAELLAARPAERPPQPPTAESPDAAPDAAVRWPDDPAPPAPPPVATPSQPRRTTRERSRSTRPDAARAEPTRPESTRYDTAVSQLVTLGRLQGFIDIADVIAIVDNAEAELERIDQICRFLNASGIEIRDGDEVVVIEPDRPTPLPTMRVPPLGDHLPDAPPPSTRPTTSERPSPPSITPPPRATPATDERRVVPPVADERRVVPPVADERRVVPPVVHRVPVPGMSPPDDTPTRPGIPIADDAPAGDADDPLSEVLRLIAASPYDASLRLGVARAAVHLGRIEIAIEQYRELLRLGLASDDVIDELNELCRDTTDTAARRKLSRILGDAYARAGRIREAVDAYARAGGKG